MPSPPALLHLTDGRHAVVTGQQAGLFGGPLYTLYKLLGAIRLAERDDAATVFWVECDDADVREVDRAAVVGPDGELVTLSVDEPQDGRPVAAHRFDVAIETALETLERSLPDTPQRALAMSSLRTHYAAGARWSDAFSGYLAAVVGEHSVVFVDPSSSEVKRAAQPFFARALSDTKALEEAVASGASAVSDAPVAHRPGELPLFLLDDQGVRRKLLRNDAGVTLKGTESTLSAAAVIALTETAPERFSTSVLLRPVLQDWLLATRAYVAGPAEERYHGQIGPLYELMDVARPRIVARPQFTLLEPRATRALRKLDVSAEEVLANGDDFAASLIRRRATVDPEVEAASTSATVAAALDALRAKLGPIDPGQLEKAFDEAARKLTYQLDKLGKRAAAALQRQHVDTGNAARRLSTLLTPVGQPQERVLSPAHVLARMSAEDLVARLESSIDPDDLGRHQFVELA